MRYVVIDIEASGFDGFPIEVGWCDHNGVCESHLIRPAWNWTVWDIRAERVHGISREHLAEQGESVEAVAKLVADMLARCQKQGVAVASDNPTFDREWLAILLRRAEIKNDFLLLNILDLYAAAVEPLFTILDEGRNQLAKPGYERDSIRSNAVTQATKEIATRPNHRAADDARRLRDIVEIIRAKVTKTINRTRSGELPLGAGNRVAP